MDLSQLVQLNSPISPHIFAGEAHAVPPAIYGKPFEAFPEASEDPLQQAELQLFQDKADRAKSDFKNATKELLLAMGIDNLQKPEGYSNLKTAQANWEKARSAKRIAAANLDKKIDEIKRASFVADFSNENSEADLDQTQAMPNVAAAPKPMRIPSRLDPCHLNNYGAANLSGCFNGATHSTLPLLHMPFSTSSLLASTDFMPVMGESSIGLTPYAGGEASASLNPDLSEIVFGEGSNPMSVDLDDDKAIALLSARAAQMIKGMEKPGNGVFFGESAPPAVTTAINSGLNSSQMTQALANSNQALNAQIGGATAAVNAVSHNFAAPTVMAPGVTAMPQTVPVFGLPVIGPTVTGGSTAVGSGAGSYSYAPPPGVPTGGSGGKGPTVTVSH